MRMANPPAAPAPQDDDRQTSRPDVPPKMLELIYYLVATTAIVAAEDYLG